MTPHTLTTTCFVMEDGWAAEGNLKEELEMIVKATSPGDQVSMSNTQQQYTINRVLYGSAQDRADTLMQMIQSACGVGHSVLSVTSKTAPKLVSQ